MSITCSDNPPRIDSSYRIVVSELVGELTLTGPGVTVTRAGVPLEGEYRVSSKLATERCTFTFTPDPEKTPFAPGDTLKVAFNSKYIQLNNKNFPPSNGAETRSFKITPSPVRLRVTFTGRDLPNVRQQAHRRVTIWTRAPYSRRTLTMQ